MIKELILKAAQNGIYLYIDNGRLAFKAQKGALSKELKSQIGQNKAAIIAHLQRQQQSNKIELPTIAKKAHLVADIPLSYAQQSLWLLDNIEQGTPQYNIPFTLKLEGQLSVDALKRAFNVIIERHHSLRTSFVLDDGEPKQLVKEHIEFNVTEYDFTHLQGDSLDKAMAELSHVEVHYVFNLSEELLFRAQLVAVKSTEHILLLNMHHIVSDGWSTGVLIKEFSHWYRVFSEDKEPELDELEIQYTDYAIWQREYFAGATYQQHLDYWTNHLAGLPLVHSLPIDFARPKEQSYEGDVYINRIDKSLATDLNALCQSAGATQFMGLHTLLSILVARFSNETDIAIGTPVSNREQSQIADLIGYFVNMVVLRSDLSEDVDFHSLLLQNKQVMLDAFAHQQVPFEQVVETIEPERNLGHSPLFQILLSFTSNDGQALSIPHLSVSGEEQPITTTKYDFTLNVIQTDDGLTFEWQYVSALFAKSTVARMASYFVSLLNAVIAAPQEKLSGLDILPDNERQQLLQRAWGPKSEFKGDQYVHELFEQQAQANPQAIAVEFENQTLTYEQLSQRSSQLAYYLQQGGLKPRQVVAICFERSMEMVVSLLAVLKVGCTYVPLDPEYPQERIAFMLEDSNAGMILTHAKLQERLVELAANNIAVIAVDSQWDEITKGISHIQATDVQFQLQDDSPLLIYIMYTSGSTGKPKGVMVEHKSINRLVVNTDFVDIRSDDVFLQFASISFDVAMFEIWGPLLNGAKLVIAPHGNEVIHQIGDLIKAHQISVLWLTSGLFQLLVKDNIKQLSNVRVMLAGGDVVPLESAKRFLAHCKGSTFINGYGPTENTTFTCCYVVPEKLSDNLNTLPIGKPIANTSVYILDQNHNMVPIGVPGELHTSGEGIALGYLNREDLTAEKFVENPFEPGRKMYKTGDMARRLDDGNIEFLGRKDTQVKIRGFRIELEEIETQLNEYPQVKDSVVIAMGQANDKHLVGFYVASDSQTNQGIDIPHEDLKAYLQQELPDYMLPVAFVSVAQIPLTPNGKVNRMALRALDIDYSVTMTYVAPSNAMEQQLVEVWAEVLSKDADTIGVNDNFFELGGHSLLVMQILPKLKRRGIDLSARQLFLTPTVKDLAALLSVQQLDIFKAPENLIASDCQQITPQMLPLVNLDEQEIAIISDAITGGVGNIQDIYTLGPLQQGILFHHMMSSDVDPYVLPLLFKVNNKQAVDEFLAAMDFVVERHEALRTVVLWNGLEKPVQVVCRHVEVPVNWLDNQAGKDAQTQMTELAAPQVQYMDLSKAPLFEVNLLADNQSAGYFMLLRFHHLISDHVGLEILLTDISAFRQGNIEALDTPVPYREFIAYTQHQETQHDATAYFTEQFGDVDEPTLLFNLQDVQGDGSNINELRQSLPQKVNDDLRAVARKLTVSPAVIFHTAWAMLVAACSGKTDVVFGTVVSGRLQGMQGAQATVGVFMNTLPLRVKLKGLSGAELVKQVKLTLAELLPYEQTSLAVAQRCSALPGDTPLFNAMLNYRHSDSGEQVDMAESDFELLDAHERSNFPFNLAVDELGHGFELTFQTEASLSVERIMNYMQSVLASLVKSLNENPAALVSGINVLPADELDILMSQFNQSAAQYPHNACIHQLFEAQVAKTPEAIALVFEQQHLTYAQLNAQANQLAHHLVSSGKVSHDNANVMVGICLERSVDMMVAMLAVLKAGGAYVPMDPEYPESRLSYMLENSGIQTVISHSTVVEALPFLSEYALCINQFTEQLAHQSANSANVQTTDVSESDLAYVIYTSGSTGKPKGVMIEHQSVVNFLFSMATTPGFTGDDAMLAVTSTSFDIHVLELFLPLIMGGKLVVASRAATIDPLQLIDTMKKEQVNVMQATPATWKMLLDANWQNDKPLKALCGGEALSDTLAKDILAQRHIELWNMYGPTETTIWSAVKQIQPHENKVFIGGPIANTQFYVVNDDVSLTPRGVPGELLIGGHGLARGYLGRDELTKAQFIDNPFYDAKDPSCSKRLYRTGDLVCWRENGEIEYLGRADQQVKIRGFRVEPGEIENQVRNSDGVKDAVVIAHHGDDGNSQLLCYFVSQKQDEDIKPVSFSLFYFGAEHCVKNQAYEFYINSGKYADANGFEAIWTPERHFDAVGSLYPNPSILSAALATVTENVHLRSGSVVIPLHDPIRVAEEWSVVDNLSQGRVGLAVASGWHSRDFVLQPQNFVNRKLCVTQSVDTLKTLWQGKTISRLDGNQQPVDIEIFPKPVQKELPLWMTAAGNPQTFKEAGRLGVNLLTHLLGQTIEEVAANIRLYRESLAQHGHDPDKGKVTIMVHTYIGEDLDQTLALAREPFINYLRAHVALVKPLLVGLGITDEQIADFDEEGALTFAFHRYSQTASLIGTLDSVLPTIKQIMTSGVNEVACLIDWMDEGLAFEALERITELKNLSGELKVSANTMEKDLRLQLHGKLPNYMVPGAFLQLDALPLTPNGKIDRKALPLPESLQQQVYVEPQTDTEKRLSKLWSEVLLVEKVGLTDNFFQLGGHSILAMQLQTKLKQEFNIDFAVDLFFELTDLESFAAYIDSATLITTTDINSHASDDDEAITDMENFTI